MAENAAESAAELEHEVPEERLRAHPELKALLLAGLGSAQLWEGRFDAARAGLAAAAEAAGGAAQAAVRHESLGRLALIDLLLGSPGRAEAHAVEAIAEAARCGLPPSAHSGVGHLVLAEIAFDRDDLAVARTALERAEAGSGARHDPLLVVGLAVLKAKLLLNSGDARGALLTLAAAERPAPADKPSPWARERIALGQCAAQLAAGDPVAALRVLSAAARGRSRPSPPRRRTWPRTIRGPRWRRSTRCPPARCGGRRRPGAAGPGPGRVGVRGSGGGPPAAGAGAGRGPPGPAAPPVPGGRPVGAAAAAGAPGPGPRARLAAPGPGRRTPPSG
ncbi:hypothetical protein ACFQ1I_33990 [Kitasatospora arboriphila]